ncbi:MAG: phage major capsid protein [Desulfurellales bacterium]|nr:MAG: phage major capsid protein [Desulfurellales bacterium]
MNRILEWKQERAKLIAEARGLLDKAEGEKRDLSGEEDVQYKALLAQADKLQAQIEREERLQQAEGSLAANSRQAPSAVIGMNAREVQQYSLVRAIWASVQNDWRGAELEREASVAVARQLRREPQGFFVPADWAQRDLLVGTNTAGGHTVATELLAQSFIDLLRNAMVVRAAGATILSGLVGNIAIPRQTGGATAYWVAENGAPTESQQAFDQVTMSPKTVGAFTDISRRLLMQSSLDVESFVRSDLATVLALAIDLASLHGTGSSNQPTGVAATSGIGSVAGGTNGLAPAWSHLVGLETEVAIDNADVNRLAYITNAKVRGKLKQVEKASNTGLFLWADGAQPVNGYPAYISNQVSSALTKGSSSGVCSAIFFGNWADLIIGLWGGLDILVDPYTGSTAGTVRVVALQDVDIAVRHAESFAAMLDALTT